MYVIRTLMIIALASCTAAFVGCASAKGKGASAHDVSIAQDESGSPEHASASGDHEPGGNAKVVLVYDDRMDVYVVSGQDDCYYTAGQFYRKVQGAWEWSVCVDGPWKTVARRNDLPPGLRKYKA